MEYLVTDMGEGIFQIKEYDEKSQVYMYLVLGTQKALLIDTGFGTIDLPGVIGDITDLPFDVVLTHGHFDHVGGAKFFDKVWVHRADEVMLTEHFDGDVEYITAESAFDLGSRVITVFPVPGHSEGSVCFYDENTNKLFTGDTACEGDVLLLFPTSTEPKVYLDSMKALRKFMEEKGITVTLPAHHRWPIEPSIIDEFIEMSELLLEDKIELKDEMTPFGPCKHGFYKRIGVLI